MAIEFVSIALVFMWVNTDRLDQPLEEVETFDMVFVALGSQPVVVDVPGEVIEAH